MQRQIFFRWLLLSATVVGFILTAKPGLPQPLAPPLIAEKDIEVYAAPRNGLFCQRGAKLGDLKRGAEVVTYEKLPAFCGLFFQYSYLRIDYTLPNGKTVTGYVHRTDDDGKDRFHLKVQ